MALIGGPFEDAFTFGRAKAAPCRNAAGAIVMVAANQPRHDHDAAGKRLGLLVTDGPTFGLGDRCSLIAGDWELAGAATVFHEYLDELGELVREAAYSTAARATANSMLAGAGWHRVVGAVPGYLRNLGGFVRYRGMEWQLPAALDSGGHHPLGDGAQQRPLITG